MQRNHTPHTWMHRNRHSSGKYTGILPLTHKCIKIVTHQVNAPESYLSHMNASNKSHSSKCTGILPLTHECTEIIIPQVNAPESYPSHMKAPKSSFLKQMRRNPTPHTWMHRNRHSSGKCTRILPLTHECTKLVTPQINTPESYPSHMNAPKSSLLRKMHRNSTHHTWMHRNHHPSNTCTRILPLTHECTEIVTHQVNAPKSYPSHMNALKSSSLR